MTNEIQNPKQKKYDLEDRTARFGESILGFVKSLPHTIENIPLISQLVRSSTSIGANYMEADCAESPKDFMHKIGICRKEAKESLHWLRMLASVNPNEKLKLRTLWKESQELVFIFAAILRKK